MAVVRRLWGYTDDATVGGTSYDGLSVLAGGDRLVPDATQFFPVTGGSFEPGIERIERNDEARGRRASTRPRPFRAAPMMTVPVATYRSVVEKVLVKTLGGGDVVSGTVGAARTHTIGVLGFGSTALPAVHAQLVRDDLNHKMGGSSFNRASFSFPLDGEGSVEFELWGLFHQHYATAAPTTSFAGISDDVMMLRDAAAYFDAGAPATEVQTITVTGTPTGGDFRLEYDGQQTAPIAYNAASTVVATSLQALTNIGATGVTAAGGPLPAAVTVTFTATTGFRDPAPLIPAAINLTGGTAPTVTVAATTPSYGTAIPDLQGFEFSFTNNLQRKWYARRNVVTRVLGGAGSPSPSGVYKLWFPQENKLGASQDVTYALNFGNPNAAQEFARDFAQVQRLVFEVTGGPLATTPVGVEVLRVTMYNAVHTGGGTDGLTARDDLSARFEGNAFYSESDSADIKIEVVNASATAIT